MQSIKTKWGAQLLRAASSIPIPFFAALIANESGGNPDAKRFEPMVLLALWQVLLGRKAAYGSIGGQDLFMFLLSGQDPLAATPAAPIVTAAAKRLESLATSFGLVQIMGYEAIAFHTQVETLQSPSGELSIAARMLTQFAQRNGLDVTKDFSELFDCWNTGRPHS